MVGLVACLPANAVALAPTLNAVLRVNGKRFSLCFSAAIHLQPAVEHLPKENDMYFEVWVSIALLGLWSCVGVMFHNSRKASRQLDEIVSLLRRIAD